MAVIRAKDQQVLTVSVGELRGLATRVTGAKELRVTRAKFTGAPSEGSPHKHDHEEVTVVLAGPVKHRIGNETVTLSAGDVVIVPAGVLHVAIPEPGKTYEAITILPAGTKYLGADGKEWAPALPGWEKW